MSEQLFGGYMSKQKRPRFSPEFRLEAAQLVVDQGYTVQKAAEAMGKWVQQLRSERQGKPAKGSPMTADQRRIQALEKRVRDLEMEKDILKKATALLMSDEMNNSR